MTTERIDEALGPYNVPTLQHVAPPGKEDDADTLAHVPSPAQAAASRCTRSGTRSISSRATRT